MQSVSQVNGVFTVFRLLQMQKLAVGSTQSIDTYREKWLEDIQLPPSSKLVETVGRYNAMHCHVFWGSREASQAYGLIDSTQCGRGYVEVIGWLVGWFVKKFVT